MKHATLLAAQGTLDFDGTQAAYRVDECIVNCLTQIAGNKERWAALQASGATDAEVAECVKVCVLSEGGFMWHGGTLPGAYRETASGPEIWIGSSWPYGKPTLKGRALVAEARRVFAIPAK